MNDSNASARVETASKRGGSADFLLQSEERFRLMIEAVKDYGIFLLDSEGYITSWNEGAERLKGYTAEEIIGRHFSTFYPPEALAKDWPAHELAVARVEGRFEDEGWRVRKDGSRFWANVVITALYGDDGQVFGFTKVTRDLSERRQYEEELRQRQQELDRANLALKEKNLELEQANIELARKNAELQDFAYVASHDLQEPLRKISTFAGLLEDEYEETIGESGRMYMDRIRASAQRMSELIKGLLAYSRVATRAQPFQETDLNRIIDGVISDLQIRIKESDGHIEVDPLPPIEADPTQVRQLFQNLIENALKFHRPGVPPMVRITYEPPATSDRRWREMCTIDVTDNGIGFDEKYLDRIFTPFQRLHSRSEYEGTGLGLAICRRVVERHGGSMTAHSVPGQGSTFTVHLPVRQNKALQVA